MAKKAEVRRGRDIASKRLITSGLTVSDLMENGMSKKDAIAEFRRRQAAQASEAASSD